MINKSHDVCSPLEPRILEAHFCPLTKLFMQHLQFQEIWIIVMCLKCLWNKLSINFQAAVLFKMTCLTCIMNFILPGIFLQRLFNLFLRIAPARFSRWEKGGPTRMKNNLKMVTNGLEPGLVFQVAKHAYTNACSDFKWWRISQRLLSVPN